MMIYKLGSSILWLQIQLKLYIIKNYAKDLASVIIIRWLLLGMGTAQSIAQIVPFVVFLCHADQTGLYGVLFQICLLLILTHPTPICLVYLYSILTEPQGQNGAVTIVFSMRRHTHKHPCSVSQSFNTLLQSYRVQLIHNS